MAQFPEPRSATYSAPRDRRSWRRNILELVNAFPETAHDALFPVHRLDEIPRRLGALGIAGAWRHQRLPDGVSDVKPIRDRDFIRFTSRIRYHPVDNARERSLFNHKPYPIAEV